ncbi:hypothetical protein JQK87_03320 [Streptomyces sp. G44]|uniref:hypothetical protein n=1 Tax=Streptomyces sp. G44 TaxID=2807632 RepID=UPI001961D413|nr:hypothetical protein [Streptomyces sp. G44]MBM7167458.1 hypothetical protein [Streptomyces sp. G44]
MAVSISAVVLLGIVVFVLIRGGHVRLGPALACGLFGFFLASTGAAPHITNAISGITGWISSI